MDERTTGLILRTRPLTESSLIVHWLTADHGRLATVAKGAHRPKSPLRGKLDLFFLAEFTFARSRRSDLHQLREVSLRATHGALRHDLHCLEQAVYCAQLIEQITETDTPLPGPFRLLIDLLDFLAAPRQAGAPPAGFHARSAAETQAVPVLAFEVKCLVDAGLAPDPARAALSPGAREILRQLAILPWDRLRPLRLSPGQFAELRRFLHGFLIHHLGRLPPGRTRALAALEEP